MSYLPIPHSIEADLAAVERAITARLGDRAEIAHAVEQSSHQTNDVRMYAVLLMLAAHLGTYTFERVKHAAAAIELIRAATLVHAMYAPPERDPVGNGAHPPIQGNVALMVGDYLLALAAGEMAQAPDNRVIAYFSQAVQAIAEGSLSPVRTLTPREDALRQYQFQAETRTAALFVAASRGGIACVGGSDADIEQVARYGAAVGVAYHITRELQTDPAIHLADGTITLAMIHAAAQGHGDVLWAALQHRDSASIASAVAALNQSDGVAQARAAASAAIERAVAALQGFSETAARRTLVSFAHAILAS